MEWEASPSGLGTFCVGLALSARSEAPCPCPWGGRTFKQAYQRCLSWQVLLRKRQHRALTGVGGWGSSSIGRPAQ